MWGGHIHVTLCAARSDTSSQLLPVRLAMAVPLLTLGSEGCRQDWLDLGGGPTLPQVLGSLEPRAPPSWLTGQSPR